MGKKDFKHHQNLMQQKWDAEDNIKKNNHKIWELKNDNLKQAHKLSMVEDQLRVFFDRLILNFDEKEVEKNV